MRSRRFEGVVDPAERSATVRSRATSTVVESIPETADSAHHSRTPEEVLAAFGSGATLIVLQLIYVYAPFMHPWFHSAPIGVREWFYTTTIAALIFLLTELSKFVERRRRGPPST